MNNLIKLGHAIIVFLAIQTVASAGTESLESGLCIPTGQAVTLCNAVVILNIKNEDTYCPEDPKTCAYYYCRHRWPPTGCQ